MTSEDISCAAIMLERRQREVVAGSLQDYSPEDARLVRVVMATIAYQHALWEISDREDIAAARRARDDYLNFLMPKLLVIDRVLDRVDRIQASLVANPRAVN